MCSIAGCHSCSSKNQRKFNGELALHVPGPESLSTPIVWAFPEVCICLDCGFAVLALEDELLKEVREIYRDDELPDPDKWARAS